MVKEANKDGGFHEVYNTYNGKKKCHFPSQLKFV